MFTVRSIRNVINELSMQNTKNTFTILSQTSFGACYIRRRGFSSLCCTTTNWTIYCRLRRLYRCTGTVILLRLVRFDGVTEGFCCYYNNNKLYIRRRNTSQLLTCKYFSRRILQRCAHFFSF